MVANLVAEQCFSGAYSRCKEQFSNWGTRDRRLRQDKVLLSKGLFFGTPHRHRSN